METVLVTGIGGSVGQYVAENLHMSGYSVIGVYRTSKPWRAKYKLIQADLAEDSLELKNIDVIIHIAANLYGNTKCLVKDNINATMNLVRMAEQKKIKKFVYLSTVSVYGKVQGELAISSNIINPGIYGVTKYVAENIVREADIPYKLIIGLPRMLGPYVNLNECRNSGFLTMTRKILCGENVVCHIPDMVYNNYMHVSDLTEFIKFIFTDFRAEGSQKVLLGAKDKLTMMEILMIMKSAVKSTSNIEAVYGDVLPDCAVISIEDAMHMGYKPMSSPDILKRFVTEQKSKCFI